MSVRPRIELRELWRAVACPTLLIYGAESWAPDPSKDGRRRPISATRGSRFSRMPAIGRITIARGDCAADDPGFPRRLISRPVANCCAQRSGARGIDLDLIEDAIVGEGIAVDHRPALRGDVRPAPRPGRSCRTACHRPIAARRASAPRPVLPNSGEMVRCSASAVRAVRAHRCGPLAGDPGSTRQ